MKLKKAIDDALAAKNKAIDARSDLTQKRKLKLKKQQKQQLIKLKTLSMQQNKIRMLILQQEKLEMNLRKVNPVAKEAAKRSNR